MDLIINVGMQMARGEPVEAIRDLRIRDLAGLMPEEVEMRILSLIGPAINEVYFNLVPNEFDPDDYDEDEY